MGLFTKRLRTPPPPPHTCPLPWLTERAAYNREGEVRQCKRCGAVWVVRGTKIHVPRWVVVADSEARENGWIE